MIMTRKDLQLEIKEVMYEKRMTHKQLAEMLGISKQGVSFLLSSPDVTFDKLFKIAEKIGLGVEIQTYRK